MKLPEISGRFTTPKPWQIAVGVALVAFTVVVGPAITHVVVGEKKKPQTTKIAAVGKIGEPWHPAAFPAALQSSPLRPQTVPMILPPQPPPIPAIAQPAVTTTPPLTATNKSGKEPVDPEQEAINAPIVIAAALGREAPPPATVVQGQKQQGGGDSALGGLLKPTETTGFRAERLAHPNMTVAEGRVIQCHNITRMTSGLAGFVRGQIARDVWSEDDTTLLIEKDSFIFGEIQHGLIAGVDRMFVLWRRIETPRPNLVRITLNSPATDEMGESGVTGDVDRHIMRKVGAAVLLSGIESVFSGLSGALSNLGRGNGNSQSQGLNLNFGSVGSQGNTLAEELLRTTITIPDTLTVNQASQCGVIVAGDMDFSSVYEIARRR